VLLKSRELEVPVGEVEEEVLVVLVVVGVLREALQGDVEVLAVTGVEVALEEVVAVDSLQGEGQEVSGFREVVEEGEGR
jgi:hypothetical protein